MENNNVNVVASMVAKKGCENEARALLTGLLEPSRKDAGCISYNLLEENDKPGHFLFVECWESAEMLDKHAAAPHFVHFLAEKDRLLASVEIMSCKKIEG